ncbi:Na+/H+ antiporter NhaC family protein [Lacrimispora sp. 210928-DFI.3.58]|uniref:Na+/H+ antiporter NhaC family protein n=1 Tax=Lacrimispora sp. 210928-DFI.3.58 TaxID=2883214 RepID=UPI0015B7748C|nr:Na+/H+ antiporter NhaC family protein [Lacrimispora sp. 210928-DFI.3.58]MCB7318218.1 hypothetical protein [Lacrimispora sp. 210928-DFI.3.58]
MEFGFWSLVPPVLTIALALITKNVFIALLIGILTGNLVLNHFSVFTGINAGIYSILDTMTESNTLIIGSVLITAAIIHLAEKSGGIEGFVNVVVKRKGIIKSKRGANLFSWVLGLAVFTSGTLSCMVTGSVSRPVNDALKVPHEKAAYIVHTTSTPWCVLFPFSGWLAAMAGYLVTGGVPEEQSVSVLFQSIALNFYCILSILMVFVLAVTQKDFGPMAKAEERAAKTGALDDPAHAKKNSDTSTSVSGATPRAMNLLIPVGVLIGVMFIALFVTGGGNLMNGSGMKALIWAVVSSLFVASVMCVAQRVFTPAEVIDEIFAGMSSMLPITFVLLFGFTMGNVVKALDTGNYLSSIFQQFLSPALLPALTFLMALMISFATGTSMGTMAIMAVIALPMGYSMGINIPLVAGAMFGGSIFGDHASPISDTTIMTCSTTGCDIIDHIKTQLPYVSGVAVVSFVLYIVCGFVM